MSRPLRALVAILIFTAVLLRGQPAAADGDEGIVETAFGTIGLVAAGLPTLALDVTSVAFIAAGPSPSRSRQVIGILTLVHGVALLGLGTWAVASRMDPEAKTVLGTIDFGLGLATVGLGIGCLRRHRPELALAVAPTVVTTIGGGPAPAISVAATF